MKEKIEKLLVLNTDSLVFKMKGSISSEDSNAKIKEFDAYKTALIEEMEGMDKFLKDFAISLQSYARVDIRAGSETHKRLLDILTKQEA